MSDSALVLTVPQAQPWVQGLRNRFDPSAREGMPAHISILVPFMPVQEITAAVLTELGDLFACCSVFDFALASIRRFAATTYLAPEPVAPFVALTRAVVRRFPDYPPYRGGHATIVPHLTVAHGNNVDAAQAAAELEEILKRCGPIRARCESVALMENSTGLWLPKAGFDLCARR